MLHRRSLRTRAHRIPRTLLAGGLILGVSVSGAAGAASAASPGATNSTPAAPAAGDASGEDTTVRLTGTLWRTAEEPGLPSQSALSTGGRFVPIESDPALTVDSGATVTLDLVVPDEVVEAAESGETLRIDDGQGGDALHPLDPSDLDALDDSAGAPAGTDSPVAAAAVDSALAPTGEDLRVAQVVTTSSTSASYTAATRTLTYVNVIPRGSRATSAIPATTAAIDRQVTRANAFWRANSRDQLGVKRAPIKPRLTSQYSCAQYWNLFDDVAARVGWTERANHSLVLVVPPNGSCGHGLGSLGDNPNSPGVLYVSDLGQDVLAHEVGHNMSLEHADALVCTGRSDAAHSGASSWANGCSQFAYGDGQDIMGIDDSGSDSALLSTPQALSTRMLPASASVSVGRSTTTVTLRPLASGAGVRVARVRNQATDTDYFVEYRTAAGRDASNAWGQATGVRVLRVNPSTGETVMLDASPTGRGGEGDRDHALRPGQSLRSYDGGVTITTVSANSTQAVVRVVNTGQKKSFTRTRDPKVNGTRMVGRTLTADPGGWSPTPSRYTYRWKRDGRVIGGATAKTYQPKTADAGRYLSVEVTAHRSGYRSSIKNSARVGIPLHNTVRPTVAGNPKVGNRVEGRVGSWTPKPGSYAYQWYRGSTKIPGATGKRYRITSADAGRGIRVKVTARRSGHSTGSAFSTTVTARR